MRVKVYVLWFVSVLYSSSFVSKFLQLSKSPIPDHEYQLGNKFPQLESDGFKKLNERRTNASHQMNEQYSTMYVAMHPIAVPSQLYRLCI